jgi:3-hydroxybutyrate dehydrogenase/3-oxoacyl-[acyl-carrier protein] reductase
MYSSTPSAEQSLSGKRAFVVGGTSGIGYALALLLAQNGVDVTVTGRHKPLQKENTFSLHFIPFDFEKEGLAGVTKPAIKKQISVSDILCVCYGPFIQKPLDCTTRADWEKNSLANYALPGLLTSTALQFMMKNKWGRILLFGGTRTDTVKGYKTNAAYAGAKTGVSVIVKSIAMEYADKGITCNAVLPGFTQKAPSGTLCVTPEQLAQKGLFLLSSPELNGVLLNVDYGWNPQKY